MARRFAAEGAAAVVVADLDGDAAAAVADEIGGAAAVAVDVADEAEVAGAGRARPRPSTAASTCSAPTPASAPSAASTVPDEDWQRSWDVNVMAHVYAARALLPGMAGAGRGLPAAHRLGRRAADQHRRRPVLGDQARRRGPGRVAVDDPRRRRRKVSCLCPQGVRTNMLLGGEDVSAGAVVLSPGGHRARGRAPRRSWRAWPTERFLILPHPEVADYVRRKAGDHDRWLAGMRRLQATIEEGLSDEASEAFGVALPLCFIGGFAFGGAVLGEPEHRRAARSPSARGDRGRPASSAATASCPSGSR